jgi:hypothetical protein
VRKKITMNASGTVISVEDVSEREVPAPQPKQSSNQRTKNKTPAGKRPKQLERRETDTPYGQPRHEIGTRPSTGRMAKHLREAHLQETINERRQEIKDLDRKLKALVSGFHSSRIAELRRMRNVLLADPEDLQSIAEERLDLTRTKNAGSFQTWSLGGFPDGGLPILRPLTTSHTTGARAPWPRR